MILVLKQKKAYKYPDLTTIYSIAYLHKKERKPTFFKIYIYLISETDCGEIPTLEGAESTGTDTSLGTTITFNCLDGWNDNNGGTDIQCEEDGWSELELVCTSKTYILNLSLSLSK